MTIHPRLRSRLELLAHRKQRLKLAMLFAICWGITGVAGLGLMGLQAVVGWYSWLALPLVGLLGLVLSVVVLLRVGHQPPDWRKLAREIEAGQRSGLPAPAGLGRSGRPS
jgi:hypothetical protein